jgi:hypothetical protein
MLAAALLAAPSVHADPAVTASGSPAPLAMAIPPVALAPPQSGAGDTRALRFTGGIALAGIGGISLILGGVMGARALVSRNDVGSHCASGVCDLTGYTLYSQARDFALISTAVLIGGAVVAAGGVALIVSARPRTSAWIAPSPGGVVMGARF